MTSIRLGECSIDTTGRWVSACGGRSRQRARRDCRDPPARQRHSRPLRDRDSARRERAATYGAVDLPPSLPMRRTRFCRRPSLGRLGGYSLIELLVFGRIVGQAAADYSASLTAQIRSAASVQIARGEIADLLAADGEENVRALQRAIRNTMTEHAEVVREEAGLLTGLAELDAIEACIADIGIHPDIAGYQDFAHVFDLKSATAARATLEAALEPRESRRCHNRSDYPDIDPALQVNLVWLPSTGVTPEEIPAVPK
ncbi:hypothetical protein GRS92_02890 [Rathayibacter sp. VKM Ac-2754]|nr:hypothetical protein [Rathayibacter sp. VKM Ac-2754]